MTLLRFKSLLDRPVRFAVLKCWLILGIDSSHVLLYSGQMLKKIALPEKTTISDCELCFRAKGNYFIATSPNNHYVKGLLSYDGIRYFYDTQDSKLTNYTFTFTSLELLFEFLTRHNDGNFDDLV